MEYDVPPSRHLSLTFAVYSDVRCPGLKEREGAVTVVQRGDITISKYQSIKMGLCKYITREEMESEILSASSLVPSTVLYLLYEFSDP